MSSSCLRAWLQRPLPDIEYVQLGDGGDGDEARGVVFLAMKRPTLKAITVPSIGICGQQRGQNDPYSDSSG